MNQPLNIWSNARLSDATEAELLARATPNRVHLVGGPKRSNQHSAGPDPACRSADIAFGQPHPLDLIESTSLRWIHLTSAGYTRYDTDELRAALKRRGAVMTNSSSVYAEPCAQQVLAMMLALSRQLPQSLLTQSTTRAWRWKEHREASSLLEGQSALLVGFGAISRRLVEMLGPFHMKLVGVRRTPRGDESIPVHAMSETNSLLPTADHVINALPAATDTERFFDASRFARMKRSAHFYNIGRGDTVDQPALINALTTGQIGAAYLDVTSPEPLPPDHPLWIAPNCFITPHTGGGHENESQRHVEHFLKNLANYIASKPLFDQIY